MKHLTNFNLFEAIIVPKELESNGTISSYDDLLDYANKNDFDLVKYTEFYNSLSDIDRKTAPPKQTPFFALFHPIRKKPMFVIAHINIPKMFPNFKNIVDGIIGHERIHAGQAGRKNAEYILPNPLDRKIYFSNKEEIMAFSYTIAKEIISNNDFHKSYGRGEDLTKVLPSKLKYSNTYAAVKKYVDQKTLNRYKKYIYLYVQKLS